MNLIKMMPNISFLSIWNIFTTISTITAAGYLANYYFGKNSNKSNGNNNDNKTKRPKKAVGVESNQDLDLFFHTEEDRKKLISINKRKPQNLWNTALFFPDYFPNKEDSVTKQMTWFIDQAVYSLQVCIYLSSHKDIERAIIDKFKEGKLVQIITDFDTMQAHNNHWKRYQKTFDGLQVRAKSFGAFMHHKFCIIDEEAVLTGSLNWTLQGVTQNKENVTITTDPRIVKKYKQTFTKMWIEYDEDLTAD